MDNSRQVESVKSTGSLASIHRTLFVKKKKEKTLASSNLLLLEVSPRHVYPTIYSYLYEYLFISIYSE